MNRYPGIHPFKESEKELFKGREAEKRELLDLVIVHPMVVLFAKSGIGKTSLLQAGVSPQMTAHKLLPVFIRFNPADRPPEQIVRETLIAEGHLSDDTPHDLTMWEYLKKARFVKHGKPYTPVLIFDQFEELFTLYDAARRAEFVRQFADVINRRMPDPVREALHRDIDQLTPLQVAQRERSLKVKVVLSIRSDMLSLLDQLSRPIPSILRCRYELKSLSRENAEKAIVLPAAAAGEFDTPPFEYSDLALKEILDFLQSRDTDTEDATTIDTRLIESFQLQLLCSHIEEHLPDTPTIHTDDYGHRAGLQKIIDDFYHDTIQSFPANRRLNIQRAIEEDLIRNERRISMAASVLKEDNHITDDDLQALVDKRLLRKETRLGAAYYEVSHDTLVKPIVKSYTLRKVEEERKEAQRKLRRVVGFGVMAVLLAVVAFAWTAWALRQRDKAEEALATVEVEQAKNERIINSLYFYDDRFALAFKNGRYGFIDKEGNTTIKYKYKEASPFNNISGYAKVKRGGLDYLIDTFGLEYTTTDNTFKLNKNIVAIDLQNEKLKKIPNSILENTQLKILLLDENELTYLPQEIGHLKQLQTLNLSKNELTSLPVEVGQLKRLREIYLYNNKVAFLPTEIGQLEQLRKLNLAANKLTSLPKEIGQLTQLQLLTLFSNQITSIPVEFGQLKQLQHLNLGRNKLTSLPATIGQLKTLRYLDMSSNKLTSLPKEIGQLKQLNTLSLYRNQLNSFPVEIMQLEQLQELQLRDNQLSSLPTEITRLKQLQTLDLSENQFSFFPEQIIQLKQLQSLSLFGNQMTSIPAEISQLKELSKLSLSHNQLSSLPTEIIELQQLEELSLGANQLTRFPKEIIKLKRLKTLSLGDNQLKELPVEIAQLKKLQTLRLGNNQLKEFPTGVFQLKELSSLRIGSNQFEELPVEIAKLEKLIILDLGNNQLKKLPIEITRLQQLHYLYLRGNQLSSLPAEIEQLKELRSLDLRYNNFSTQEKEKIKKLLPNCKIKF